MLEEPSGRARAGDKPRYRHLCPAPRKKRGGSPRPAPLPADVASPYRLIGLVGAGDLAA